jgi:hypothetical protein
MTPEQMLLLAVKNALRVELGHLEDLIKEGFSVDSLPIMCAKQNITMYRRAIITYNEKGE